MKDPWCSGNAYYLCLSGVAKPLFASSNYLFHALVIFGTRLGTGIPQLFKVFGAITHSVYLSIDWQGFRETYGITKDHNVM